MEENMNKKQNHKIMIFAIALSVISIGILVFGFFLVSSDKVVMLQSVSNLTSKLNHVVNDNSLLTKLATNNDIGVKSSIGLKSDLLGLEGKLDFDYLENREDKKSDLSLQFSMKDEENKDQKLLDFNTILQDNKIYFFVDELTPQYYHTSLDYISVFSNLTGEDYEKIIGYVKEAVTNSIDDKKIEKEKKTISYNGKDKKVNVLTYKITKDTVYDIMNKLFTSIKKDKSLLGHVASFTNITTEELTKDFDKALKEMKDTEIDLELDYRVYYYGFNKIIGYELFDPEENCMIQYKIEDKEIINLYVDKEIVLNLEILKKKDQYHFEGYILSTEKIPFSGVYDSKSNLEILIMDSIKLTATVNTYDENNEYHSNIKIDLSMDKQTVGSITIESEYSFGEKVKANIKNSTSIDKISEKDIEKIMENLENYPLYDIIKGLSEELPLGL